MRRRTSRILRRTNNSLRKTSMMLRHTSETFRKTSKMLRMTSETFRITSEMLPTTGIGVPDDLRGGKYDLKGTSNDLFRWSR